MTEPAVKATIQGLSLAMLVIAQHVEKIKPGLSQELEDAASRLKAIGTSSNDVEYVEILASTLKIQKR